MTVAQTSYTWDTATTGNWSTSARWSPAGVPGSLDTATVAVAGTYTVQVNSNQSISSLTVSNSSATLSHTAGTLAVGGSIALTAGVYSLNGGTISGGSITSGGGSLRPVNSGGILNNVTVGAGVLDFSAFSQLQVRGTSTIAAGTYTLNAGSDIGFEQTTTLNGLTINLAGFAPSLSVNGVNTLTLGPTTTVTSTTPASALLTSGVFVAGAGAIQNRGLINTSGGGALVINPTAFANLSGGVVRASNGQVQIDTGGVINQAGGTFDVSGGSLLLLGTNWSNQGAMTVSSGTLQLGGSFTTAGIGTLTRTGGTVTIIGALDNTAATLALNATTGSYRLEQNGSITGGSLTAAGGSRLQLSSGNGNRLNNVAVGPNVLDFGLINGRVRLQGTSTLAAGTALALGNAFNVIGFEQTTTLNDLVVNLSASGSSLSVEGNNTLTLGSSTTVTGSGSVAITSGALVAGTGVVQNQGLISGGLTINPTTFTNQSTGTVRASGGTVSIPDSTTLSNVASNTLTGGTWDIQANSTLDFGSRTVSTLAANTTVQLTGANSNFAALNSLTANAGTLTVGGGRTFAPTGGAVSNTGLLQIGAGSTVTADVSVQAGGTVRGVGTVAGSLSYILTGGTLSPGPVPGSGPAVLTVTNNLSLNSATTVAFDLNGATAGTGYDQLVVNGNVTLGGAAPGLTFGYTPAAGDKLFLVNKTSAGPISGEFAGLSEGATVTLGGQTFTVSYLGNFDTLSTSGGNDLVLFNFTPVPESTTAVGVAALGLLALRLRRGRLA